MKTISKMMMVAVVAFMGLATQAQAGDAYPRQFSIDARKIVATHSLRNMTSHMMLQSGEKLDTVVSFANGSDKLTAAGLANVAKVAKEFKAMGHGKHLMVKGYTDSKGKVAANQSLSERRAAAVVKALVKKFGVPATSIMGKGFGSADPVATNETAVGRAANRRVEFVVMDGMRCNR